MLIAMASNLWAQDIWWDIDFMGFADNREYNSAVQVPQSIMGTRFAPEIGLSLDSLHLFGVGFNSVHEFGDNKLLKSIDLQLYYKFKGNCFDFTFGSFSKSEMYRNAPRALYYDSLLYFRPNANGLLWTYHKGGFTQSVYLDWTSRKADNIRETFIMGGFGEYSNDYLYIKNHIYMYHYAGANNPIPNDIVGVRDNGVAYVGVGFKLNHWIPLDQFSFSVGGIQSYERIRNIEDWNTPIGMLSMVKLEHKGFGACNTLYIGEGHNLDWGDPFYQLNRYNRIDIYYSPLRFEKVKATFGISFHIAEKRIQHQQQFYIHININSDKDKESEFFHSLLL